MMTRGNAYRLEKPSSYDNPSFHANEAGMSNDHSDGHFKESEFGVNELEEGRDRWDNRFQYLLALIGFAVGLGNIWRFPWLAQANGGGAFLIPYFSMLIFAGIPILVLEVSLGQRMRNGPCIAYGMISYRWVGIGVSMLCASSFVAMFYNTVLTWCLFYFYNSFQYPLPWSSCSDMGMPSEAQRDICEDVGATRYFWSHRTLHIAKSVHPEDGGFNWRIFLALLSAWLFVYAAMFKGIKSSGKVIYFTALFPYFVISIFIIRGVTLEGAGDGLEHMFKPNFDKIDDPMVWLDAAGQIFFSLSAAFGGTLAMASYMPPKNNCVADALITAVVNSATSLYASIAVFSIVGYKANQDYDVCLEKYSDSLEDVFALNYSDYVDQRDLWKNGQNVTVFFYNSLGGIESEMRNVADVTGCNLKDFLSSSISGTGLTFITMSEAMNQFGGTGAPIFAILFFLMLVSLGIDSMFGTMECITTTVYDFKILKKIPRQLLLAVLCLCFFALAIAFSADQGSYLVDIFDKYGVSYPLVVIGLGECIAVAWFYGLDQFSYDIQLMTGFRANLYFLICWKFVTPILIICIIIGSIRDLIKDGIEYDTYDIITGVGVTEDYPLGIELLNLFLFLFAVLWMPILFVLLKGKIEKDTFPAEQLKKERQIRSFNPSDIEKLLFWPSKKYKYM